MPDPEHSPDSGRSGTLRKPPARRRSATRRPIAIVAVLALVGLVGAGVWLWLRGDGESPGPSGRAAAADSAGVVDPAADSAIDLPELDASDELLRRMAAELSARPEWASWLATDALVRRFVRAVVAVGAGSSPREQIEFMAPEGDFSTRPPERAASGGEPSGGAPGGAEPGAAAADAAEPSGERAVVDPETYRRYDAATAVFVSLDTEGSARLYRRLRPLFDEAYRELGFTAPSFDVPMARAVETLLAVPVPEGPIEVVPDGAEAWRFSDPELEALSPSQKHLLRMGPENARRVQAKLRELGRAMDLPTPAVRGG